MAREIKYFNGSGAGTLYTVPVGRTAKVTFNYVDAPFGESIIVAGRTAMTNSSRLGFQVSDIVSTSASMVSPGENQSVAYNYGTNEPIIVTSTWYIGAGATVSATNNGSPVTYNFLVIEEY